MKYYHVIAVSGALLSGCMAVYEEKPRLETMEQYERRGVHGDYIRVRIPRLCGTGNTLLEDFVNRVIQSRSKAAVKEAQQRVREARQAQSETGERGMPVSVHMDYKLHYAARSTVSFTVYKTETLANAYTEQWIYNLDLGSGKEVTLRDVLGAEFRSIADAAVRRQMAERIRREKALYFSGKDGFSGVNERTKFRLDNKGRAVIVFNKYEIGPGCMGIQEFVIDRE